MPSPWQQGCLQTLQMLLSLSGCLVVPTLAPQIPAGCRRQLWVKLQRKLLWKLRAQLPHGGMAAALQSSQGILLWCEVGGLHQWMLRELEKH